MIRRLLREYLGIEDKPEPAPCSRECMWEKQSERDINRKAYWSDGEVFSSERVGVVYLLRCKTCGDLKNHVVGGEG